MENKMIEVLELINGTTKENPITLWDIVKKCDLRPSEARDIVRLLLKLGVANLKGG